MSAEGLFGDDTSPEVEQFLLAAYRRMSGTEKIERLRALNRVTLTLARSNSRYMLPYASERIVD